jgi:hypothetical protein
VSLASLVVDLGFVPEVFTEIATAVLKLDRCVGGRSLAHQVRFSRPPRELFLSRLSNSEWFFIDQKLLLVVTMSSCESARVGSTTDTWPVIGQKQGYYD